MARRFAPHPPTRSRDHARESGFSLVEVVVVLVLLGILTAMLVLSGRGSRDSARTRAAVSAAKSYAAAIDAFADDHGGRSPASPSADWPDAQAGPVNVGSSGQAYLPKLPEAVVDGTLLVANSAADDGPGGRIPSRLVYRKVGETGWQLAVQLAGADGGQSSWRDRCSLGSDLPAGVKPC